MSKSRDSDFPPPPVEYQAILESISDGVFTVGLDWRIRSFNRAAEEITSIPREEAVGRLCSEVFRSSMCGRDCGLRRTLKTGKPVIGKSGYIINPEGARIPISISTAVLRNERGEVAGGAETFRDLREVEALRHELDGRFRIGDIVSRSPAMQRLFEVLPAIAASSSTVLVLGETGTGKELIARTIHSLSPRAKRPFVAVNCGALPENLLESELFGYKAGAFTGADRDKPGRFALAKGGVIFLDEIGEIAPAVQVKLLRVLQEGVHEPLGSVKPESSDARVIAATNRDLGRLMAEGRFREDLFYRINVARLELPPLRGRKEDIPLLADHFIQHFNVLEGKQIRGLSDDALSALMLHHWPGNVRELRNAIERAFILCDEDILHLRHLPSELHFSDTIGRPKGKDMRSARSRMEAQAIQEALNRNNYNRLSAAKDLGIHKSTLFRKIRKLGLDLPEKDGRSRQSDTE